MNQFSQIKGNYYYIYSILYQEYCSYRNQLFCTHFFLPDAPDYDGGANIATYNVQIKGTADEGEVKEIYKVSITRIKIQCLTGTER